MAKKKQVENIEWHAKDELRGPLIVGTYPYRAEADYAMTQMRLLKIRHTTQNGPEQRKFWKISIQANLLGSEVKIAQWMILKISHQTEWLRGWLAECQHGWKGRRRQEKTCCRSLRMMLAIRKQYFLRKVILIGSLRPGQSWDSASVQHLVFTSFDKASL